MNRKNIHYFYFIAFILINLLLFQHHMVIAPSPVRHLMSWRHPFEVTDVGSTWCEAYLWLLPATPFDVSDVVILAWESAVLFDVAASHPVGRVQYLTCRTQGQNSHDQV